MGAIDLKALNREKNLVIAADTDLEGGLNLLNSIMPTLIARRGIARKLLVETDTGVRRCLNHDFDMLQAILMNILGLMDEPKKSE